MMGKYIIFFLAVSLLSAHKLIAQDQQKAENVNARTSQTTAAGITYTYDTAGNRIKRLSSGGSGCINTWTGNASAQWNNVGNWSLGVIPQPCHTVVIPTLGGKPYPILDINSTVSNIEFSGGSLNMNGFNIIISFDAGCAATCP
jgi:hypothetical protein